MNGGPVLSGNPTAYGARRGFLQGFMSDMAFAFYATRMDLGVVALSGALLRCCRDPEVYFSASRHGPLHLLALAIRMSVAPSMPWSSSVRSPVARRAASCAHGRGGGRRQGRLHVKRPDVRILEPDRAGVARRRTWARRPTHWNAEAHRQAAGHAGDTSSASSILGHHLHYEARRHPSSTGFRCASSRRFVLILGPSGSARAPAQRFTAHSPRCAVNWVVMPSCAENRCRTPRSRTSRPKSHVFQDPEAQSSHRVRDESVSGWKSLRLPTRSWRDRPRPRYVGLPDAGDLSISTCRAAEAAVSIAAVSPSAQPSRLDEPTANLDPAGMAEVFAVLHR